ncbi:hypothetical protein MTO96_027312 [Rhipicephalus appendiculatus]
MERTLQQRARIYNRDTNITSLDFLPPVFGNSMEVLRELVRSVVREELQKQRLDQNAPMLSSLADVIREEVRQVVQEPQLSAQREAPLQQQPRITYADVLQRGAPGHVFKYADSLPAAYMPFIVSRNGTGNRDIWKDTPLGTTRENYIGPDIYAQSLTYDTVLYEDQPNVADRSIRQNRLMVSQARLPAYELPHV